MSDNTMPEKIGQVKNLIWSKAELAVRRALEVARVEVVDNTNFPVISGRYKASLQGEAYEQVQGDAINDVAIDNKGVIGTLGTNVPYAKRVEFGFEDTDSLGRQYHQKGQYNLTRGFQAASDNIAKTINNTMKL